MVAVPPGAQTLEQYLLSRAPLGAHELAPIFGPLVDQLAALHAGGGWQGNLGTDTILVQMGPAGPQLSLAPAGLPAPGTWPYYQAPEQLAEGLATGYWTDIYSLAAVIFRALTGQPPFPGTSPDQVITGHLQYPQPTLLMMRPDLSSTLDQMLIRAMTKAPNERLASVAELKGAFEATSAPPGAPQPPAYATPGPAMPAAPPATFVMGAAPPGAPRKKGGGVLVIAMIGLLAVGGAGAAFVLLSSTKEKSESHSTATTTKADTTAPARPRTPARPRVPPPRDGARAGLKLPAPGEKLPAKRIVVGPNTRVRLPVAGRPTHGPRDAPVVVAVYGDLQCPWTARTLPLIKSLAAKYPRDVRVVWLDFPLRFHKQALPAAIAARSVLQQQGEKPFWRFVEKVLTNYRQISTDQLVEWAEGVGAQGPTVRGALRRQHGKDVIEAEMRAGKAVGIRGTPTLVVNGRIYKGRRSLQRLSEWVELELAQARRTIGRGGVTRAGYYGHLMKSAVGKAPPKGALQGLAGLAGKPAPKPARKRRKKYDPKALYKIPLLRKEPWRGAKRPLVVIVHWGDFQCPYCRYAACTMAEVMKRYKRTVRHVFRHLPLSMHKLAMPAAEASMVAFARKGNRGFWKMYDRLYPVHLCPRRTAKVRPLKWLKGAAAAKDHLLPAALARHARKARLRSSRFRRDMRRHKQQAAVEEHVRLAKAMGIRGTPIFFVNGRMVRGAVSFPVFKKVIDEELRKARRLLKSGVKQRRLYDTITSKGVTRLVLLKD